MSLFRLVSPLLFNLFYDFFCMYLTSAIKKPNTRNPPGARMKSSIPSLPPIRLWPKMAPAPSSSRIAPARVRATVKPRPMPMPSITESRGVCLLADKERKCVVEAQFDISTLDLKPLFDDGDIDYDDHLLIRREISPSGKSRAFVNDTPVQLPFLRTLGTRLVDIHSQHQTLTLADSAFRFDLLDSFSSDGAKTLSAYREAYSTYSSLKRDLEALTATESQNRKEQVHLKIPYFVLISGVP